MNESTRYLTWAGIWGTMAAVELYFNWEHLAYLSIGFGIYDLGKGLYYLHKERNEQ